MATINIATQYRPARLGFVVRDGNLSDLHQVAGICSLLWGGAYNPIIPVSSDSDNKLAHRLVKAFRPDVLFEVCEFKPLQDFSARYQDLISPSFVGRSLFMAESRTLKQVVTYLDVITLIDKLWADEFRHKQDGYVSRCRLPTWDVSDELSNVFTLSFGRYDVGRDLADDYKHAFLKGLRADTFFLRSNADIPADLATFVTPLTLTFERLRLRSESFGRKSGLFIGDPNSFSDLTTFWNLRAGGTHVEFLPNIETSRADAFIGATLAQLDSVPDQHPNIPDSILLIDTQGGEVARASLNKFSTTKPRKIFSWDDVAWTSQNFTPVKAYFDNSHSLAHVDTDQYGYAITIALPEQSFIDDSRRRNAQLLAVSMQPLGESAYPGYTIAPPFRTDLNETYSREMGVGLRSIRSEPEGVASQISTGTRSFHLRPIARKATIEALLGLAAIQTESSQPGRLADRMIEKLGGLEHARVFKIRGARHLIQGLNADASVGRGEATKAIWNDGQFAEHERLHIEPRDAPKLIADRVFDFLLRKEFFRAGLTLYCDHCKLASWLSLRQMDDAWVCEFCGHSNLTSVHLKNRGDWRFRKSGLLAKDNNQEGAIPVLLTLLVFKRLGSMDDLSYSTSLKLASSGWSCEADFVVTTQDRDKQIHCGIGEAKSDGGSIDRDDVANFRRVHAALASIGVVPHFVFAKTATDFLPEELSLFRELKVDNIKPILFTRRELEPLYPYEGETKETLPHPYAASFDELAVNSDHLYLKQP